LPVGGSEPEEDRGNWIVCDCAVLLAAAAASATA